MNGSSLFIATASWEPRFLEGALRILDEGTCTDALCFWFEDYEQRTADARARFDRDFAQFSPKWGKLKLSSTLTSESDGAGLWRKIFDVLSPYLSTIKSFVFDISTTPREALWITLDLLTEAHIPGAIVYHRPESHGNWCGGEPERPHIVPKLGGISELDRATRLIVVSGFDEDRSEQFISYYEPEQTKIILQEGPDHEAKQSRRPHVDRFSGRQGVVLESMDSYSDDWGYEYLADAASGFASEANLLLASVGPKTSAVSLYRLQRQIPNSALVYSPCREYNENYSKGIGETYRLDWSHRLVEGTASGLAARA